MAKNKLTQREQRLLDVLPAAMILAIYSFLVALPFQQRIQAKASKLQLTKEASYDQRAADQSLETLTTAQLNLERLRERLATDRMKIKQRSQSWRTPEDQLEIIHLITEMLGQYNLSIVSQDFELEPPLSEYFQGVTEMINRYSPNASPLQFWKIELEGGYTDVRKFLDAIDLETMNTFAASISMVASEENDGQHKWTILFVV